MIDIEALLSERILVLDGAMGRRVPDGTRLARPALAGLGSPKGWGGKRHE